MEGRGLAGNNAITGAPGGRSRRLRGPTAGNWEDWASAAIFLVAPLVAVLFLHFLANDAY